MEQAKWHFEDNNAAENKYIANFFINTLTPRSRLEVWSEPLEGFVDNFVTDDESLANIMNNYFYWVLTTTPGVISNINKNGTNTISVATVVDYRSATTRRDNDNKANNNNYVLDQHICDYITLTPYEQTLQNFEITTEDLLNTLNNMKTKVMDQSTLFHTTLKKRNWYGAIFVLTALFNKSLWPGLVLTRRQRGSPRSSRKAAYIHQRITDPLAWHQKSTKCLKILLDTKKFVTYKNNSLIRDSQHGFISKNLVQVICKHFVMIYFMSLISKYY